MMRVGKQENIDMLRSMILRAHIRHVLISRAYITRLAVVPEARLVKARNSRMVDGQRVDAFRYFPVWRSKRARGTYFKNKRTTHSSLSN